MLALHFDIADVLKGGEVSEPNGLVLPSSTCNEITIQIQVIIEYSKTGSYQN